MSLEAEWETAKPDLKTEWDQAGKSQPQQSSSSPALAGMVNFGAGLAGLPIDIAQGVYNAPKMAYGLVKGALGSTDLPEPVTGTPGGSESLRKAFQIASELTGYKSLSPENPTPQSEKGTLAYNLASKGAMVPGMALPALAAETAERTLGPQYGPLGALVPGAAISAYNSARAPSLATAKSQNAVRDRTMKEAQDVGYVTPPSAVNPTGLGNTVESFAGKGSMKQAAELKNQQVTNALVREELKVPKNTELTEGLLDKLRNDAAKPYREISDLSISAERAVEALKTARSDAKDYWRAYDRSQAPADKKNAIIADKRAEAFEEFLDRQAKLANRPELIPQLREARTYIAKTYDVERALNVGNGNVDAQVIGRIRDRRGPDAMTGNLKLIGEFAEGPGRQFTREASKVPAPGVHGLSLPFAAALGLEGYTHLGSYGAALAGIPFLRSGARGLMLSKPGQALAHPSYEPALQPGNPLVQQGILSNE